MVYNAQPPKNNRKQWKKVCVIHKRLQYFFSWEMILYMIIIVENEDLLMQLHMMESQNW